MRVIKSETGFLAFQKIFRQLELSRSVLLFWQLDQASGRRQVSESTLRSFNLDKGFIYLELPKDSVVNSELPIFCYAEEGQFIFKTSISSVKENNFTINVPSEVKLLEGAEITAIRSQIGIDLSNIWLVKRFQAEDETTSATDFLKARTMLERSSRDQNFLNNEFDNVSIDEEERMFADKRESPRSRPKLEKWVKVKGQTTHQVHLLKLFDLSRGGMSFVVINPILFPKGSSVEIIGFDEFDLDDPLAGMVMSHRALDESQIEFKIGIKFNDGQE
ncbi:MAG TPA: PilZ domain-containing protein [Bacteriovoracaceae bacterium]|nr:PilZ domain-containing protein [Bacteriovoracaceae bacterium]